MPPALSHAVADEDLSDTCFPRKCDKRFGRIPMSLQHSDGRTELTRDRQISFQRRLVFCGQIRLTDISNNQFAVKPIGVAPAALQNRPGIGTGRNTDENSLLNSPDLLDIVRMQITAQLVFDDFSGYQ